MYQRFPWQIHKGLMSSLPNDAFSQQKGRIEWNRFQNVQITAAANPLY